MRREAEARSLLEGMVARHERSLGGRRIIARPSQSFDDPEALRALTEGLRAAADAGAVSLVWDRDASHLVAQVVLEDAGKLYTFLGRTPASELAAAAATNLQALAPSTDVARQLVAELLEAWPGGRRIAGLAAGDVHGAIALVRAIDAALAELPADVPLRTRSARLLGDSKALERALPSVVAYLRHAGRVEPDVPLEEAVQGLGLAKYQQPVLVAGPLLVSGTDVSGWPYVGVPPDMAVDVTPSGAVRSILTVENLESFNRHVRTVRRPDDVVVYIGGFPSPAVLAVLRRVLAGSGLLHHWGDIDPGGLRIGRYLENSLGVPIRPHLMDEALARRLGTAPSASQSVPRVPEGSAFFGLGTYLRAPGAAWLEQEVVDPEMVAPE